MGCREKSFVLPGMASPLLLEAKEGAVAVELGEGEEGRRKLEEEEGGKCDFIYL